MASTINICTFGAPPVGNQAYVDMFNSHIDGFHYLIVNFMDPVPRSLDLADKMIGGLTSLLSKSGADKNSLIKEKYQHTSELIYLDDKNGVYMDLASEAKSQVKSILINTYKLIIFKNL